MAQLIIDADTHLTEPPDVWVTRVPKRYLEHVPHVVRNDEGRDVWVLDGVPFSSPGMTAVAGWPEPFPAGPKTYEECHPASYDADARLRYMDEVGIWAQVLYPNVAGGTFKADFLDTNVRGWDAVIRANFGWLLHSTHLAATQMRTQGRGGSIISITSIEGHRAAPGYAVYAGMKGAVTNFSRTLALELAPDRIRVNTIAPDQTPTEGMPMDYEERVITAGIPMGRQGTYDDIGGAALFLASDLSEYITGTTLHPDGGAWASAGWFNWPGEGYVNNPPVSAFEH